MLPLALVLVTYNLNYANPDRDATMRAIAGTNADVVLLQEVDEKWQRALSARFADQYPHQAYRLWNRAAGGSAILSKLDIRSEESLPSPEWFPAQRIVLATPLGSVQLLNVHLRPAWDGSWIKGYVTTPPMRLREVEAYWPKLSHELPTIVAGDFNEAPNGGAVAFLAKHGLTRVPTSPDGPSTWHYELLHMDIDHVMIDHSFAAANARVLDVGTSDHRPVIVTITSLGRS